MGHNNKHIIFDFKRSVTGLSITIVLILLLLCTTLGSILADYTGILSNGQYIAACALISALALTLYAVRTSLRMRKGIMDMERTLDLNVKDIFPP